MNDNVFEVTVILEKTNNFTRNSLQLWQLYCVVSVIFRFVLMIIRSNYFKHSRRITTQKRKNCKNFYTSKNYTDFGSNQIQKFISNKTCSYNYPSYSCSRTICVFGICLLQIYKTIVQNTKNTFRRYNKCFKSE